MLTKLQRAYIQARANNESVKAIEKKAKLFILKNNVFMTEEDHDEPSERIFDSLSDFRMSEADFIEYCKLTYAKYIELGLYVPDYNTTADYKTRVELREAEDNLLAYAKKFTVIRMPEITEELFDRMARHWKLRSELLDLIVKLRLTKGELK